MGVGGTLSPFGNRCTARREICSSSTERTLLQAGESLLCQHNKGRREAGGEGHREVGKTRGAHQPPLPKRAGCAATKLFPWPPRFFSQLPRQPREKPGILGIIDAISLLLGGHRDQPTAGSWKLEAGLGPRKAEQYGPSGADCCRGESRAWTCSGSGGVRPALWTTPPLPLFQGP